MRYINPHLLLPLPLLPGVGVWFELEFRSFRAGVRVKSPTKGLGNPAWQSIRNNRMLPASAPIAVSSAVLSDSDMTSIQFSVIQLLNSILHVWRWRKLYHTVFTMSHDKNTHCHIGTCNNTNVLTCLTNYQYTSTRQSWVMLSGCGVKTDIAHVSWHVILCELGLCKLTIN